MSTETFKRTLNKDENCPCCGAKKKMYRHKLSKGLVDSLILFAKTARNKGISAVHLLEDMKLDNASYNNFNKLKYWGLVRMVHGDAGKWELTPKGIEFLQNRITVPLRVITFRNRVVERDTEEVNIASIVGSFDEQYWQEEFSFRIVATRIVPVDYESPVEQTGLFSNA